MVPYAAPLDDMRFTLNDVVDLARVTQLPGFEDFDPDMLHAVLDEAAKVAETVLAPLNLSGDQAHARLVEDGVVRMPDGFKAAYEAYRDGGWNAVPFDPAYGGGGLPWAVAFAVQEMWHSANMAFGLCPLLNQGAVELLQVHGSEEQRKTYLEKLISGHWTGTMNLTEPQAGSDLSQVRSRAVPAPEGRPGAYWIKGQKIFITYGEHDLAPNIVHMVLARLPDAPEGTKGISLFIVPKFIPGEDGTLGRRNDVQCVSLEHKLGINASPTCTMAFGDQSDGALGYLVGAEHQGLKLMFTMMNNARLSVGLEGVAIAERAFAQALAFARERVQSRHVERPRQPPVRIIEHADVRRMLLTMKALTQAARALTYEAAVQLDLAKRDPDAETRRRAQARVDLLTPVVKTWSTDVGCEVASLGVQVHGGMGYVEETGAAQHYRDARIAPIYEGTNGIQANDLIFRKVLRDQGTAALAFMDEVRQTCSALETEANGAYSTMRRRLTEGVEALHTATRWIIDEGGPHPERAAAAAYPYASLFGTVAGGHMMARAALAAGQAPKSPFTESKLACARFYAEQILPRALGYLPMIVDGHHVVTETPESLI